MNIKTYIEIEVDVTYLAEPAEPDIGVQASLQVEQVFCNGVDITSAITESQSDILCDEYREKSRAEYEGRGDWMRDMRRDNA